MRFLQGMRDAQLKDPYNRTYLPTFLTSLMIETRL